MRSNHSGNVPRDERMAMAAVRLGIHDWTWIYWRFAGIPDRELTGISRLKLMSLGLQEIVALIIVAAVVGFALYRRWRRSSKADVGCSGCEDKRTSATNDKPINFYRRQR